MQILLILQLRSWIPNFQRIQNFRLHSYFNLCSSAIEVYYQDIILNEIASDESHFTFWDHFGLETLQSTLAAILYWSAYRNFGYSTSWKNETPPMAFVMERSNYHGRRVLIHLRWAETETGLRITEMLRNYFETRVRNPWYYKIPAQTLLIDGERWLRRKGRPCC